MADKSIDAVEELLKNQLDKDFKSDPKLQQYEKTTSNFFKEIKESNMEENLTAGFDLVINNYKAILTRDEIEEFERDLKSSSEYYTKLLEKVNKFSETLQKDPELLDKFLNPSEGDQPKNLKLLQENIGIDSNKTGIYQVLGMTPFMLYAIHKVANERFDGGYIDEAEKIYQLLVMLNAENSDYWMGIAIIHKNQGKLNDAIYELLQAGFNDPTNPQPHIFLAECYKAQGLSQEAKDELQLAEEKTNYNNK